MGIGKNIFDLEFKLGYKFREVSYLERAMTHLSYANEQRAKGINIIPNERLEFLGDAVIQIIISEYLYQNYRKHREGALTKMRQRLVCEKTLAKIAAELNLGDYINLGNGEETTNCRERPKILADTLEALVAAVYLDSKDVSGEIVRKVVLDLFAESLKTDSMQKRVDYKTMLQQLVEQDGTSTLEYQIIEETGPEHNKTFTVAALVNNNKVGEGKGRTKRQAEMQAAKVALKLFGLIVK